MNKHTAEMLHASAQNLGIECHLNAAYSGRGMYGRETYGLVLNNTNDIHPLIADACVALAADVGAHDLIKQMNDFIKQTKKLKQDSMGRGCVYY